MALPGRALHTAIAIVLSLTTLILLILVLLGDRSASSPVEQSLYFLRINTTAFTLAGYLPSPVDDFYTLGLWGYCSGTANGTTVYCSPPKAAYYLDPLDVWQIRNTPLEANIPASWTSGLDTYQNVARWIFIVYVVAVIASAVMIPLSVVASFTGRLGSLATGVVASVTAVCTVGAAVLATALNAKLLAFVENKFGPYGVTGSLGSSMFAVTWIAAVFSIAVALFWTFSCCSFTRSARHERKTRGTVWGMQHGEAYERVPSPYRDADTYDSGNGMPLQQRWPGRDVKGGSYEDFRVEERT